MEIELKLYLRFLVIHSILMYFASLPSHFRLVVKILYGELDTEPEFELSVLVSMENDIDVDFTHFLLLPPTLLNLNSSFNGTIERSELESESKFGLRNPTINTYVDFFSLFRNLPYPLPHSNLNWGFNEKIKGSEVESGKFGFSALKNLKIDIRVDFFIVFYHWLLPHLNLTPPLRPRNYNI